MAEDCCTNPCDTCKIPELPTPQARLAGAKAVDYMLGIQGNPYTLSPKGLETLAEWAAEEFGVQEAKEQILESARVALVNECASRETSN